MTGNFADNTAPVCSITGGTTATLNCTDGAGVVAYYFGTTLNPSAGSYIAVSSSTDWSTTVTPDTIGVYYLYAKDAAGNISAVKSAKYLRVEVEVGAEPDPMQNFSCSSLTTTGQTVKLKDTRDGSVYNVTKLADGKCWMLDNLAFNGKDNQGSGSYVAMDSSNTNISGSATWNDTIRTGWTSSTQDSYTASYINDASKDVIPEGEDTKSKAGGWKVGVYYNYCAATVNTICSSDISTEASQDVCPKGWRLPTGGDSGEFQTLYSNSNYNTYDKYRDALHLPFSGYFYSGQPRNQGSYGYWWSSTAFYGANRYDLRVDISGIYSVYSNDRQIGNSIRCVAK